MAVPFFASSPRFRIFVLLAVLFCLAVGSGRADLVILKDGFLLHGRIKRDSEPVADARTGMVYWMAKLNGFYWVNDGARQVSFSANQVVDATKQDIIQDAEKISLGRVNVPVRMESFWQMEDAQDFNQRWERDIKIRTGQGRRLRVTQRITELTPQHLRLEALEYSWTAFYLTREFKPDNLRSLIVAYWKKMQKKGTQKISDIDIGFYLFRFLLQAGWLDEAEKELAELKIRFPEEKKRLEANREVLRKLQAMRLADHIERAFRAGQHIQVRSLLARFQREKINENLLGERKLGTVLAIQKKVAEADENIQRARRYLQELPSQVTNFNDRPIFQEAARVMQEHLNPDTVNRIDGFIGLALQAERDRKKTRTPDHGPEQLLALAISGWLMGNDASETNVPWALKLWETRKFLLLYQNTPDAADRQKQRLSYSQKQPLPLDEVAQMIRFLPPPETEDREKKEKAEEIGTRGQNQAIREIKLTATGKGATYFVQLPPEYHPYRSYPVLVVLHEGDGNARAMLERWSDLAAKHGYILAAPNWGGGTYLFSPEDHAVVINVLRDLRRRFQADTDRVFLSGFEQGGKMAYDVGLSHPDLFAGVIPIAAPPRWHAIHYWTNAQYLPFYVVDGTANGTDPKFNRDQFKKWVNRAYPSIYVEYLGRGPEWFGAELPFIFDWMGLKKRAHPTQILGSDPFASMRETDNRFYWLSADSIKAGCLNEAGRAWNNTRKPAQLSASVGAASNTIYVNASGIKEFTIWFPPGLVNFGSPVNVRVNGAPAWTKKPIPTSVDVLLEDFYQRGDRFQVVLAMKRFVVR